MIAYVAGRVLLAIPTLLGAVTLVFVVVRILPGDPVRTIAGSQGATGEDIAALRREMGIDRPIHVQYLRFLAQLARGELGISLIGRTPVATEITARLPYTVRLAVVAMLIATTLGVTAGILAAIARGSWADLVVSSLAVAGVSTPVFWLGLMLIVLLSVDVRIFPAGGVEGSLAWVLPSVTLSGVALGLIARTTRSSMLETLGQDYVRTARAKGLTRTAVVVRHALQNALLPVITVVGLQFGQLLGGAVLVETVFSWPGIGRLLVDSILQRDYTLIQGVVLVFAAAFIALNIVVDVCYVHVDPRIRY